MTDQNQLVTFELAQDLYGINIMDVKEIVRVQDVRPIPNAPVYVEGIFNLRSEIIPVINLHKRFHLKSAGDAGAPGFIIVDLDGMKLGVIIDKVSRVLTVSAGEVQPPPEMLSGIGAEYIHGVVRRESGYLIILDIRSLFNPKELQKISELRK